MNYSVPWDFVPLYKILREKRLSSMRQDGGGELLECGYCFCPYLIDCPCGCGRGLQNKSSNLVLYCLWTEIFREFRTHPLVPQSFPYQMSLAKPCLSVRTEMESNARPQKALGRCSCATPEVREEHLIIQSTRAPGGWRACALFIRGLLPKEKVTF